MDLKKHWSVDTDELAKNSEAFTIWKIEQRVNWGIGEGKMRITDLRKYWDKIDIDPFKRRALELAVFSL